MKATPFQTSATIIDRHDFTGDILELIGEAEKYMLKNIHIGMQLDGLRRLDVPAISRDALREAIINVSRRRNPLVADLLHRIHLIKAWERGVPLILEKARVEFRETGGLFTASFVRN